MLRAADVAYGIAAVTTAPIWLWRMTRTGKIRTDWPGRFGRTEPWPRTARPRILVHAVSVGEINACRLLVDRLAAAPEQPELVIVAGTDTGVARAASIYGDRHRVARFPFDFTPAVSRFLDAIRPDAVVLAELEVWPNFGRLCEERGIPVGVVNGRISARGIGRYRLVRPLVRPAFRRLAFAAVQNETYGDRFRELGTDPDRVQVTGTMKWDTAEITDAAAGMGALRDAMGIDPGQPLVVAGSTAPTETTLLHRAMPAGVQLLCAPRKPEWFDRAASDLPGCARRSRGDRGSETGRFLLDTIGELRAAYALADLVVVGRTFEALGGSDMIEPVALGKATVVGPETANFEDAVAALLEGDEDGAGLVQIGASSLPRVVRELLEDNAARQRIATAGRAVIRREQGATDRHVELIRSLLPGGSRSSGLGRRPHFSGPRPPVDQPGDPIANHPPTQARLAP